MAHAGIEYTTNKSSLPPLAKIIPAHDSSKEFNLSQAINKTLTEAEIKDVLKQLESIIPAQSESYKKIRDILSKDFSKPDTVATGRVSFQFTINNFKSFLTCFIIIKVISVIPIPPN